MRPTVTFIFSLSLTPLSVLFLDDKDIETSILRAKTAQQNHNRVLLLFPFPESEGPECERLKRDLAKLQAVHGMTAVVPLTDPSWTLPALSAFAAALKKD